ncbi:MAG: hypothetical protein LBJ00_11085 [Planctomycetaceae bacterium]|jgi:hypothetical protein|nr:hypothetical protein [Planctomycetaceae bacterium]
MIIHSSFIVISQKIVPNPIIVPVILEHIKDTGQAQELLKILFAKNCQKQIIQIRSIFSQYKLIEIDRIE